VRRVNPLLLALALMTGGCPGVTTDPVPTACARVGDKCKLPSGPLGVCLQAESCPEGSGPCFVCQPQH
jgi:hypothetical protein